MQRLAICLVLKLLSFGICITSHWLSATEVKIIHNHELPSVATLQNILEQVISPDKPKTGKIKAIIIFDNDGVLFPMGGSNPENLDQTMAETLAKLKKEPGVAVGVVTNRHSKYAAKDLKTFKAEFGGLNLLPGTSQNYKSGCVFKQGAFYVNKVFSKGQAMKKILQMLKKRGRLDANSTLVFIDDSPGNLDPVIEECRDMGLKEIFAMHYIASWKAAFSVKIGEFFTLPMLLIRKLTSWLPYSLQPRMI